MQDMQVVKYMLSILTAIYRLGQIAIRGPLTLFKSAACFRKKSNTSTRPFEQSAPKTFKCRVLPVKEKKSDFDVFTVEICGSVPASEGTDRAAMQICITDITEGISKSKPVKGQFEQCQQHNSDAFCYEADLGKVPEKVFTLSDWTAVAQVQTDWMVFPRRGRRNLQLSACILPQRRDRQLASAKCLFSYENTQPGYVDQLENIRRARILAVTLAFAVGVNDNKLYDCEVALIKKWARGKLVFYQTSEKSKRKFEKALNRIVIFFRNGNKVNIRKICREVVDIVPPVERYDILEFCMNVIKAKGTVCPEELVLLRNLAKWLDIDSNRFQSIMEKTLPFSIHQLEDADVILGLESDMTKVETLQHLSKEYRKWSARVTNLNSEIRAQADHMLKLISKTRCEKMD